MAVGETTVSSRGCRYIVDLEAAQNKRKLATISLFSILASIPMKPRQ